MVGIELRQAREKAGMTQEQLAFRAGVSRNYVSLLELDQKSPTLATLDRLCQALGIRMSQIITQMEKRRARR